MDVLRVSCSGVVFSKLPKTAWCEVQGTVKGTPFDRARLNRLLDLAQLGTRRMFAHQREALDGLL